ncbi:TniQ family protein [Aquitalea pelogenes]|uniref:TniQ family protein n=1 Tax=Aquitalea pelogenes TaxID=1293573 RepID=UPI0035AEE57C
MNHQLPFFPSSLPDETLLSRVSRYHLLSGNKTIPVTFDELFGKPPFPLEQIVPLGIEVLATKLPGEQRDELKKLLLENTLLPLFLPYLAPTRVSTNLTVDPSEVVSHIPRRVVGMHGEAHLCLECVRDDQRAYGVPYWHRSHQIPGVSICWKHRTPLLDSCPVCGCPFLLSKKLLGIPWQPCRCAWQPNVASLPSGQDSIAHEYALFAHDLLIGNLPPIPPQHLFTTYKERAIQLDFTRGSMVAVEQLQDAIIDHYGEPFIKEVDAAYASARRKNWLRLTSYQSALDTPITRHILLSLYLFGGVEQLSHQLRNGGKKMKGEPSSELQGANGASKDTEISLQQKEFHRSKVLKAKQRRPTTTIQALWKQSFKSMSWLYDNDLTWLQKHVLQPQTATSTKTIGPAADDERFAAKVDNFSRTYFANNSGKPLRLTIGRLMGCIEKRLRTFYGDRERFPLTFERIDYHTESLWHFRARRILWAIDELQALGEMISTANIASVSGVSFHWVNDIVDYCEWHCETLALQSIDIPSFLLRSGIPHNWPGPQRPDLQINGGRRHISQVQMEPKSYLDFILNPEPRKPHNWASRSRKRQPTSF